MTARCRSPAEDCGMDREHGLKEACQFVKRLDFEPSLATKGGSYAD